MDAAHLAALRAGWLESLLWLLVNLTVAMVVVALDAFDGATQGSFVGGFPTASVLLWGYSYRIPGGVGSGLAISAAIAVSESNLTGNITNSVLYIAVGGVAAWAFQVLRNSELGRLRAEAELEEERGARIRSEERAEVAAHLHDSVLQTLALIQKGSADASEVRHLARVQERELRAPRCGSACRCTATGRGWDEREGEGVPGRRPRSVPGRGSGRDRRPCRAHWARPTPLTPPSS
jgi:signal transduction histidine kinase